MNIFGVPFGFGGSSPSQSSGGANGNNGDANANNPSGNANESGGTGNQANASNGSGSSAAANDTAPAQTVAAPSAPSQVSQSPRSAAPASAAPSRAATPEPEPVSGAERAFAEQTATRLFFESLVQNIREVPEAADLGLRDPAANEGEDTGFTARSEGDIAADRFREGLKLVSA